jgi:hypothetical protein
MGNSRLTMATKRLCFAIGRLAESDGCPQIDGQDIECKYGYTFLRPPPASDCYLCWTEFIVKKFLRGE